MKIVFMGTSQFAVPSLNALVKNHEVIAVITQPDRAAGRGKSITMPPVKICALEHGITVLQPQRVKNADEVEKIRELNPDIIVVAAFGQILSKEILDIPTYGCINVHGSLLPKYRGAAPIQQSIIDGEEYTGVTIMHMDVGIDTGDMILKTKVPILDEDNFTTLLDKLSNVGAEDLIKALQLIEEGSAVRIKQDDSEATHARMIKKEDGIINWSQESKSIINLIRGLDPWPTAYTFYEGKLIKIWKATPIDGERFKNAKCGEVVDITKGEGFVVKTGDSAVVVNIVQEIGGKRMSSSDYMRGHEIKLGVVLCQYTEST